MSIKRRDLVWIVPLGAATGFFGWLGLRTYRILKLKTKVGAPNWQPLPRQPLELPALKPWQWRNLSTPKGAAVLVVLPRAVAGSLLYQGHHLLALSRICSHQGCVVNFVDNPELGSIAYNYRSDHPFLSCPCHFGAYDMLQAGKAVHGPPRFPLKRFRLEVVNDVVCITGVEGANSVSS